MTIGTSANDISQTSLTAPVAPTAKISASAQPSKTTSPGNSSSPIQEDHVELSDVAQKEAASATQPTLDQIIRRAADGDIRALAQLTLL